MIYFIAGATALSILAYLKHAGPFHGLPILLYHKVSDSTVDDLTITASQLEKHFQYIIRKKYTTIFLSDLRAYIIEDKPLPDKPLLLTFDDGYKNNYTNLYPLLQKYHLKANIFLTAGFIETDSEDLVRHSEFLHINDIHLINKETIQFALHTFDHKNYATLSIPEIDEDLKRSKERLDVLKIPYEPCHSYTYGAYPKKNAKKRKEMFDVLKSNGVELGMRIGNRINKLPLKNKLLIERIDIRGNESFLKFRISLAAGRKILFK